MSFFRRIWIWVFFLAFVLFLFSSSPNSGNSWSSLERLFVELTAPLQNLFTRTVQATKDFWLDYFYLVDVRQENERFKAEIQSLRMENQRYREMAAGYERLQNLLQFRRTIAHPVLAARVIGRDPSGWFKSIIIDKGAKDGLTASMPVVNADGLVGRIVAVSPHYAQVLLLIDQNSAVDILILPSRDRGILRGQSSEACRLEYVAKASSVRKGDPVITSGLAGVFPKGIPVGHVLTVAEPRGELFKEVTLRTAVDFSKLEEVLVILKPREEETSIFRNEQTDK
ncbi:rod shape-determining protein MreC [Desulfatiglans anilini]|uniref:rod shape-determining protein MreC n=1 Tax=Desulfatiglans anilini TaxID=90728 RepID=UPI000688CEC1|nr:rod shape-determining protein MreC [Desulfatiglans anilini]